MTEEQENVSKSLDKAFRHYLHSRLVMKNAKRMFDNAVKGYIELNRREAINGKAEPLFDSAQSEAIFRFWVTEVQLKPEQSNKG